MEMREEKALIKATSQEGKSQQSGANTENYFWFAAPSTGCHSTGKQPLFVCFFHASVWERDRLTKSSAREVSGFLPARL